uniref:PX domain-containing protein n=1 Tax=Arcella intermedia TaxID=1963864 RepID=A0A6B2L6P8_9EUKA
MNAYVTYVVSLKKPNGYTSSIVRRYSDFDWLYGILKAEFKHLIVPPLPEKVLFDRFSVENVENRRKELEKFINRVINDARFSKSESVKLFLTANETVMNNERAKPRTQEKAEEKKKEEKKGFFSAISAITAVVAGPSVEFKEVDPWYDSQKSYLNSLDIHLKILISKVNSNIKKREDIIVSLDEFSKAASLACGSEVGQDDALADFWGKFSDILLQMGNLSRELANGETDIFESQLRDYVRLVGASKELLDNRNASLLKLQTCQADASSKSEKVHKATKSKAALEAELQLANKATEDANQEFNFMTHSAKEELENFKKEKSDHLRSALRELVTTNINHQLRVVDLWKELLGEIDKL